MSRIRRSTTLLAAAFALAGVSVLPGTLQAQSVAETAPASVAPQASPAQHPLPGPRLAPQREAASPLLPGETRERELNAVVRRANTVTIPVVTLLLGIIILILLVD